MSSPAFIVGTGRCGSTLLSRALATHSSVLSISEYFTVLGGIECLRWSPLDGHELWQRMALPSADVAAFLNYADQVPELIGASRERKHASPLLLVPLPQLTEDTATVLHDLREYIRHLPRAAIAVQHERVFRWLQRRLAKQVWVERSGGALHYVDILLQHWPEAKLVHIARRGTDCARSMSRHPFFRVKLARILNKNPGLSVDACMVQDLPLDRFGALWSAEMLRAESVLKRVPRERLKLLRYEDLLSSPMAVLHELGQFLDPPAEHAAWATGAGHMVRSPTHAAELYSPALELACRPGMRVYERMAQGSVAS